MPTTRTPRSGWPEWRSGETTSSATTSSTQSRAARATTACWPPRPWSPWTVRSGRGWGCSARPASRSRGPPSGTADWRWALTSAAAGWPARTGTTWPRSRCCYSVGMPLTFVYFILLDRMVRGLAALQPQGCSIYDRRFWRHERFWKVCAYTYVQAVNGTPFKGLVWRLLGVRVGRRLFDDGCIITERVFVT